MWCMHIMERTLDQLRQFIGECLATMRSDPTPQTTTAPKHATQCAATQCAATQYAATQYTRVPVREPSPTELDDWVIDVNGFH